MNNEEITNIDGNNKRRGDGAYQDWCINAISQLMNMPLGDWELKGYADVIKQIILHYADVYQVHNERHELKHINIYWNFNQANKRSFFQNVLMSSQAKRMIDDSEWRNGVELHNRQTESIHFEHILPKQQAFENLLARRSQMHGQLTADCVREILRHEKIVVITRSESRCLDGRGIRFEAEDINEFQRLGFGGDQNNMLGQRPKDHGSALLRMVRLWRLPETATKFCWYDRDDELLPNEWPAALEGSCI